MAKRRFTLAAKREHDPSPFPTLLIRFPWCPSVNHALRVVNGRPIKSKQAREFQSAAWQAIYEQNIPRRGLSHPMEIVITQHAKTARGDVDNGLKLLVDALKTTGVIYDDSREIVKRVIAQDGSRSHDPYVTVEIRALAYNLT